MKLDRLTIGAFKNLRDFTIDFDETSLTTVVVGRNGTGKSNLLEALIIIFRDLDLGKPPTFAFTLDYTCRGAKVHIDANPSREKDQVRVKIDMGGVGISIPYKQFWQKSNPRYLPDYVFGYYSGPSNRMEAHFAEHQERFYRDLLANKPQPLRRLFYARLVHSQFVLLAFFTEQDEKTLRLLEEHLRIKGLDSVLFVMKEPEWAKGSGKRGVAGADPRFWNARGTVRDFLDKLYDLSLAPLKISQRVSLGFGSKTTEHLYLYLPARDALQKLAAGYSSRQELFKALESTYISDLISEVRIRVWTRNADGSLTFRELSEGEQQLLMVLGLLRFTNEDEALFLLDEPDTHLNPAWSLQYLDFLKDFVGKMKTSHIIMATHDPLVIAGLEKEQVQIMTRDEQTGRISAELPAEDPRGMGVGALLTSDVYGLRSQLDLPTLRMFDRRRDLATKQGELTPDERAELGRLNAELQNLGILRSDPNPLYERFELAVADEERKTHDAPAAVLSPEEVERQRERAADIVRKLKARKPGESGEL